MQCWYRHFSDSLPSEGFGPQERLVVEYLTGRIPLLLRDLLQFKGQPYDEPKFLLSGGLQKVRRDIAEFYQKSQEQSAWHAREKPYVCLLLLSVET
jgi:hypothetical protein